MFRERGITKAFTDARDMDWQEISGLNAAPLPFSIPERGGDGHEFAIANLLAERLDGVDLFGVSHSVKPSFCYYRARPFDGASSAAGGPA